VQLLLTSVVQLYYSVLGLFGSQSISQATKSRLSHKKIWITDEISMVSLKELVRLSKQCDDIWDLNRSSNTVFGSTYTYFNLLRGFQSV
jgi:hypothetical protein